MIVRLWWRLVQFGFRLLYHELAFTYDMVSAVVSLGEWRSWQRAVIPHLPARDSGLVLDLAHGTGNLHLDLLQAGYRCIGLDLSPQMGRITARKLTRRGLLPRLVRGSAFWLPFADGVFQAVVCTFPTDFIVQKATLNELARVVQPQGRVIVVLNGVFTSRGVVRALLAWLFRITGQNASEELVQADLERYFEHPLWRVSVFKHSCPHSVVQGVVLTRH